MKKVVGETGKSGRFARYSILLFSTVLIINMIVSGTYRGDSSFAFIMLFLWFGLPLLIVGIVIMKVLLMIKVRFNFEIIAVAIIVISIILIFSTMIYKSENPLEEWEYSEELTELYLLSRDQQNDPVEPIGVYLGENTSNGREVTVYSYFAYTDHYAIYTTGIEKDGKLFIDNWRVYPTKYVGISHFGENPIGQGSVVYLDNLATAADTYTIYLKDDSGNLLNNLSNYNATVGDILAVFGEWEDGPVGVHKHSDYLVIDKIEIVEILG